MIAHNIATLLQEHVTLDLEGIDRIYLNAYQPLLQTEGGVAWFFKQQRGMKVVGSSLMAPISNAFVKQLERLAAEQKIPVVCGKKGERKEDLARQHLKTHGDKEGVYLMIKAQEKSCAFRTTRKTNPATGQSYPWLYRSTVMCNQWYLYIWDKDFGPLFIKFSSYFPYTARVCLNGHEYAKRQLEQEGIAYEPLDNGFLSCRNPQRLQEILEQLDRAKIEVVFRKWLARLPQPFTAQEQQTCCRYELSVLQIEFARTQVFDKPVAGRQFFEEVIRENIDLGRPENVSLIFERRVTKATPGLFRTRIITPGVIPMLHVSYKYSKIKQYFKEGRALRTETTINNTRDFGVGRKLINLPALRELGFRANRRLLEIQQLSHDCLSGGALLKQATEPVMVEGQRASALRFGDPRAMALLSALCMFAHLPAGFANKDLRRGVAGLMGEAPERYSAGRMSYDLRRLRLHGLIERKKGRQRYEVTAMGMRVALLLTKVHSRVLRPGCSRPMENNTHAGSRVLTKALLKIETAVELLFQAARLSA